MYSVIVAVADNGAIGKDNQLMWRLSADLKRFKNITTGHTIVMGRNTYLSIGKPLPNRRNVILSRTMEAEAAPGCEVIRSLSELAVDEGEEVFIIGGGQVYRDLFEMADRLYVTHVHMNESGDVYFPFMAPYQWKVTSIEHTEVDEKNEYETDFVIYDRVR